MFDFLLKSKPKHKIGTQVEVKEIHASQLPKDALEALAALIGSMSEKKFGPDMDVAEYELMIKRVEAFLHRSTCDCEGCADNRKKVARWRKEHMEKNPGVDKKFTPEQDKIIEVMGDFLAFCAVQYDVEAHN